MARHTRMLLTLAPATRALAIGVALGLLAWAGMELTRGEGRIAALWLPNALLVAWLVRADRNLGWRYLAAGFFANCLAGVTIGDTILSAAITSGVNIAEVVIVRAGIRRFVGETLNFSNLTEIVKFTAISGVAAIVSAMLASIALAPRNIIIDPAVWARWFMADVLGLVLGVPTFLLLMIAWRERRLPNAAELIEWIVVLGVGTVAVSAVFAQTRYPFLFLVCPVVLFAAFRLGVRGTVATIALIAVIAVVFTAHGSGPIALVRGDLATKVWTLQIFLICSYAIGLTVAALLAAKTTARLELAAQNDFTSLILGNIAEVIFRTDAAGRWEFLNPAWTQMTGQPLDQALGRPCIAMVHPDDHATLRGLHIRLEAGEVSKGTLALRMITQDGQIRHIITDINALHAPGNGFSGTVGNIRDVTDQHLVAEALAESRRGFETLANLSPAGIFRTNIAGEVTYVNAAWLRLSGLTRAQAMGPGWAIALPEIDRVRVQTDWAAAVARGESYQSEFRFLRGDGTMSWVAVISAPDLDQDGHITGHIGVVLDVTKAKDLETALNAARERAEDATLAKAKFLANMSHEIRTPMNGVIGFTDLLLRSELSDEQRRQALLIADSGRAMMRLLNDILDLSKANAGQMTIATEPVDIRHLLRGCVALMSPLALEKGLDLIYEVEADVPRWLSLDGLRIRQVVLNLLGNAIKFTKQGKIVLRIGQAPADAGTLVIAIIDSGAGIAPSRQAAIFDEFAQASDGIARDHGGTGLGLTISRKLVQLMGGELSLDSELGRGSCFRITLPVKPAAPPVDDRSAGRDGVVDQLRLSSDAQTKSCHHVLLVEDHDINQALMTDMLDMLGVSVDVAENGAVSIERVREAALSDKPYDLVLMDMQMPVMGGIDAARAIRAAGFDAAYLPIVALTANAYAEDVASCLDAGMQAHLAKPIGVGALSATLLRWCKSQPEHAIVITPTAKPSLQARYDARKLDTLSRAAALIRGATFSDDAVSDVIDALHKLAGSAGMFGEADLGEAAHRMEQGLLSWNREELATQAEGVLEELKAAA